MTWTTQGIEDEADPRHVESIVKDLKLESTNPVSTPAEKHPPVCPDDNEYLDAKGHREYRGVVAKANYLGADRTDIQHTVQFLSRAMDKPQMKHLRAMKRFGRYLKGVPRLVQVFPWRDMTYDKFADEVKTWSDADSASIESGRGPEFAHASR